MLPGPNRHRAWVMDTTNIGQQNTPPPTSRPQDTKDKEETELFCNDLVRATESAGNNLPPDKRKLMFLEAFYEKSYGPSDIECWSTIDHLKDEFGKLRVFRTASAGEMHKIENECIRRGHMCFFDAYSEATANGSCIRCGP
jgi:hypothetical protein